MYITIQQAAKYYGIKKKRLLNLYYSDRDNGRTDRFVVEDGVLKVHIDYLYPHRQEVERLFQIALETAHGNEKEIARVLSRATGKKVHTVYMYIRNFKFKNHKFAAQVINTLRQFIRQNNLFYIQEQA